MRDMTASSNNVPEKPIEPWLVDVGMPDASVTTIRLFGADTTDPHAPLVVIWPGFGVGARYYDPIARHLHAHGFHVATGELRGQGASDAQASRQHTWGYHHLASEDYPLSIRVAKQKLGLDKDHPTVLLCHSMGGQIAALFMARPEAQELNVLGFMGVGSGTPYYRGFTGKQRWRLLIGPRIMKIIIACAGYQPAGILDVSGYGRQAKDHLYEWIRYSQTNHLSKLAGADIDYEEAKKQITAPILLTRFINDEDCPLESAKNLADSLPQAHITIEEFPKELTLGHNRWAREPHATANRFIEFCRCLPLNPAQP